MARARVGKTTLEVGNREETGTVCFVRDCIVHLPFMVSL